MTLLTDSSLLNFLLQDSSSDISSQNKVPPCLSHLRAYSVDGSKESSPNSNVEALKKKKNKKKKKHTFKDESLDGLENDDIIKLLESTSIFPSAKVKSNRLSNESRNAKKSSSLKDKVERNEQKHNKPKESVDKKRDEDVEDNAKKEKRKEKRKKKRKEEEERLSKVKGRNSQSEIESQQETDGSSIPDVPFSAAPLINDESYTRHADSLVSLEVEERLQNDEKLTQEKQNLYEDRLEELEIHGNKTSRSTPPDDKETEVVSEISQEKKHVVSQSKTRSNDWMKELIRQELEKNKVMTNHKSKGKQRDLSSGLSSNKYREEPQSIRKSHEKPKKEPTPEFNSRNISLEREERKKDATDTKGEKEDGINSAEPSSAEPTNKASKRRKRGGKKHRKDASMKDNSGDTKEVKT